MAVLPYFFGGLRLPEGYVFWDWLWENSSIEDYWLQLSLARLGSLVFGIVLAWFVYRWGSDLHGPNLGLIACFLVTFSPNVIAHAGLATLDIGAAATTVAAAHYYYRWAEKPSLRVCVLSAFWTGIACLTKMSAVVFLPAVFVVMLLVVKRGRSLVASFTVKALRRAAASVAAFVLVTGGVIWAGYLFDVGTLYGYTPPGCEADTWFSEGLAESFSTYTIPAPQFLVGFIAVIEHNECGHLAYLLGNTSGHGWWYYFPIAVGVKTTIPLLLLFGMSIGLSASNRFDGLARPVMIATAMFATILAIGMSSNINIGIRHVLAAYPMMALAGAAVLAKRASGVRVGRRWVIGMLLLGWHGVESFAAHPDYLPYFNQIARGREEKIIIDSNLDWGQDLERLSHFLKDNRDVSVRVIYQGYTNLRQLGVSELSRPRPGENRPAWLAASIHRLVFSRKDIPALNKYWGREPDARIGKSIFLYRLDENHFSLVESDGPSREETIVRSDGRSIPVVSRRLIGWVDQMKWSPDSLYVGGWAIDRESKKSASEIVIFVDGEAEESWYRRAARPDVERKHPEVPRARYQIHLGYSPPVAREQPEIRVFAISAEGKASELNYRKTYQDENRSWVLGKRRPQRPEK